MVATALALNIKRQESLSVINSFVDSVTVEKLARKRAILRSSNNTAKLRKEVLDEILKCNDGLVVLTNENVAIPACIPIIQSCSQDADLFIKKCNKIQWFIILALALGILGGIGYVLINNIINRYLICFLIWDLSCVSLIFTLRLIIKDWKDNLYGQK